jgi:hypothetical protein
VRHFGPDLVDGDAAGGPSIDSLVITAFKSRKFPGQGARSLVANARNCSRASRLKVTAMPVRRRNCSSS